MKKYRIGYTQGTYDTFHIGHLNLLNHAKEQCEYLIVGINSDRLVQQYKNKIPIINELDRSEIVANIKVVDKVVIVDTLDKIEILKIFHFDAIFIGDDWKGNPRWEETRINLLEHNVDTIFLPHTGGGKQQHNSRKNEFKIGYTTGTFDMFHIGHLHILQKAKELCDYLIVGVSTDELVQSYKHHLPVISFQERMKIVKSVRCVDEVIAQENRDKIAAYEKLHFDMMFVGDDWKGNQLFNNVEKYLNERGAEVVYFPYTKGISSTMLRNIIKA